MAEGYRQRREALEPEVAALHLDDAVLTAQQGREAARLALLAEKSALLEAGRNGLLPDAELRSLIERLDARLAELDVQREEA